MDAIGSDSGSLLCDVIVLIKMTTINTAYLAVVERLRKHGIKYEDSCDHIQRLSELYEDCDDRTSFVIEQLEYI